MSTVIINGNKYFAEEGEPLKELLIKYGMAFPCGGMGKCGKCRVNCPEMEITDKDRRFLSENALKDGWRIACDKEVGDYTLTCPPPARPEKVRELSSCNIIAYIGVKEIKIGICDDEIAEVVTVSNPLYGEDKLAGVAKAYEKDPSVCTKALKAVLSKESIELFEKYGKAKAETFAIATNGLFANVLLGKKLEEKPDYNKETEEDTLDLPTECVYILPVIDFYMGGEILAETVGLPENSMFICCDEIFTAVSIGREDNVAAAMWDMEYDETGLKAVRAIILTLKEKGVTPFVYLYGEYADDVEDILIKEDLNFSRREMTLDAPAKVIGGLRFRTKLNKEKARTSVLNLLGNETFHKFFAE